MNNTCTQIIEITVICKFLNTIQYYPFLISCNPMVPAYIMCILIQSLVIYNCYSFQTPFFWLSKNWEPENVDYGRLTACLYFQFMFPVLYWLPVIFFMYNV